MPPPVPSPALLLAQVEFGRYVVALGVLLAFVIVAGLVVLVIRRRLLGSEGGSDDSGGVFGQLRGMRDRGEISDEEFERIRGVMIDRMRGGDERPGSATGSITESSRPPSSSPPERPGETESGS